MRSKTLAATMTLDEIGALQSHPEWGNGTSTVSELEPSHFPGYDMEALAANIAVNGMREPLVVVFDENGEERWLQNGHHRAVAARMIGLPEVPVRIIDERI